MHEDEDAEPKAVTFECPYCHQKFKHRQSHVRHVTSICKKLPGAEAVTGPRVPAKVSVPVVEVRLDQELNDLLGTVESDYVRWRLAKELGVAQQSTYPVLFNFRFPGSKNSTISSVCATSEPNTVMYNVLTDARINFQIDRIVMPKNVRLIDHDGAQVDISKFLNEYV